MTTTTAAEEKFLQKRVSSDDAGWFQVDRQDLEDMQVGQTLEDMQVEEEALEQHQDAEEPKPEGFTQRLFRVGLGSSVALTRSPSCKQVGPLPSVFYSKQEQIYSKAYKHYPPFGRDTCLYLTCINLLYFAREGLG